LFLKLGCIGFGGPAVHIAMMEEEVVRKRAWMDHEHFLDLVGATNLIPGPNSTEMTMHIGHERAGWKGLIVAGCCFILPAVIITAFFAWLYQQYGQLPQVQALHLWHQTSYHCCGCCINDQPRKKSFEEH
jgi:chromate transporter